MCLFNGLLTSMLMTVELVNNTGLLIVTEQCQLNDLTTPTEK